MIRIRSTISMFLLCLFIQTFPSQAVTISTVIDNSLITRSVVSTPYEKITIDATTPYGNDQNMIFRDVEHYYDRNNPIISNTQLINATRWDIIREVELMICYRGSLGDSYVLQTGFDATIFAVIYSMKQTEGYLKIYEVDCSDPSPTISDSSDCYVGSMDLYNVTDGISEYFQIVFQIGDSCDCIGCDVTELFCRDVDVGGFVDKSMDGCEICIHQREYEYIPGACPEPIISNLTECDAVSGTISVPYQFHSYHYFVNATMYSSLTFSTCGGAINTKVRIYYDLSDGQNFGWIEHPERNPEHPNHWLDIDSCGAGDSGEEFVLYPIDIYHLTFIMIQVRAFGTETGNYDLAVICSDTAPPITTDDFSEPETDDILRNQTLGCGDSVQETLLNGDNHLYHFMIDATNYMSVFFSTCGSEMETSLRVDDSPIWSDRRSSHCDSDGDYSNEQYFVTWSDSVGVADIDGYVDVRAFDSGDYILEVVCQEKDHVTVEMNCGDAIHASTDGSIDRYTFNVTATNYMAVYWFTCGSEIETKLRVADANDNRIDQSSEYPCESGDAFMLGWIDDYDGSIITVDVIAWDSGNYTLHVECQEYSTIADINCDDRMVGNTLVSYGVNYKFVNPVDQSVIFDICSVSHVVELTLYDSDWSTPRNQIFVSDEGGDWRNNKSDCAHWTSRDVDAFGTNILAAGEYVLRVERPAAFLFDVICNEEYVFPDPRTSDLIGDRCNYIQPYPDDEIWPIDACFAFAQPDENYTYSMHWLCDFDTNGDVIVSQHWYNQTAECNKYGQDPLHTSTFDESQIFSFNCNAVDTCPFVHITQFDDCNPSRDDPIECIANNGYEAGGYVMNECFVVQTPGNGFESVKRRCSDVTQSVIEMYYVGFDCTQEHNYANVTYDIAGFVGNRYWLFDSCPTNAAIPQTTISDMDTTHQTTEDVSKSATTHQTTEDGVEASTTEIIGESTAFIPSTMMEDSVSCRKVLFVLFVCVLRIVLD